MAAEVFAVELRTGERGAARNAAGWHLCLVVAERLLDGNPIAPIVGTRALEYGWERLRALYASLVQGESAH